MPFYPKKYSDLEITQIFKALIFLICQNICLLNTQVRSSSMKELYFFFLPEKLLDMGIFLVFILYCNVG